MVLELLQQSDLSKVIYYLFPSFHITVKKLKKLNIRKAQTQNKKDISFGVSRIISRFWLWGSLHEPLQFVKFPEPVCEMGLPVPHIVKVSYETTCV